MDPVTESLNELHRRISALTGGEVASYIPKLAQADPDDFGIAITSMSGHRYQAGKADTAFTIQSVSKPFVYALALTDLGPDEMLRHVGAEPSGEAFNAISLEPGTGRPANPMVNAGAIATTALVKAADPAARSARILGWLSAFAGRPLDHDEDVYASEAASGDRNRALAYLMRSAGSLEDDPYSVTDTYFRQCSVRVTAADLAVMAATLAKGGLNPVTGERVVSQDVAVRTLAVMATCGMYDGAGQWLLNVGLPAKSGVAGGLIAASPGRFGIALYSTPLDTEGNPVRAVAALTEMSERFSLHLMHAPVHLTTTVTDTVHAARSSRARDSAQAAVLDRDPRRIAVVGAQGDLEFTETEQLLNAVVRATPATPGAMVLDLTAVTGISPGPATMIIATLADLQRRGHHVAIALQQPFLDQADGHPGSWTTTRDDAVAWCEDRFLSGEHPVGAQDIAPHSQ
ncbi:glutaminase A [Kitasatospora sp. NBC_01287]|uniref:glutaminase A n=1 Tax=Kitasatospora sp. NBC_01287 TaxID=2903573 RepID=UPI00224CC7AE|nr:glutaminase A [Kitasatospora sp. NBC_01287]MCX4751280.1 glutaminase A [Kitasatospora sp. NBC_01287]